MTGGLTIQQKRALDFIERYVAENRISPTFEEIAAELGLASRSGASRIVEALVRRGRLRKHPNRARAIDLVERVDAMFHLQRILDVIQTNGSVSKDDSIVIAAAAAMEDRQ